MLDALVLVNAKLWYVAAVCLVYNVQVPEKILVSAAHLLLSLMTSVRPAHLYNSALVQRLYADGITATDCPQQVRLTSSSLVYWFLPRDAMLASYVMSSFVRLSVRPSQVGVVQRRLNLESH